MSAETSQIHGKHLVNAVLSELTSLRKSEGLTLAKASRCEVLLELPATVREMKRAGLPEPFSHEQRVVVLVRLLHEQTARGGDLPSQALRNAFAIGSQSDPGTLTQRRNDFAVQSSVSVHAVRDYEDTKLRELAFRLIGLGFEVASTTELPLDDHVRIDLTPTTERHRLRLHRVDRTCRYVSGRTPSSLLTSLTFEALEDDVEEFETYVLYTGGTEHLDFEAIDGCEVRLEKPDMDVTDNLLVNKVRFDRRLSKGQMHRMSYRASFKPGASEPLPFLYWNVSSPTYLLVDCIEFADDACPEIVRTTVATGPERLYSGLAAPKALTPRKGFVINTVTHPTVGYTYSMFWDWPDNSA